MGPFSGLVFWSPLIKRKTAEVKSLFLGLRVPSSGPRSGDKIWVREEWNFSWLWTRTFAAQIARDSGNDVRRGRSMCETKTKCDGRLLQASYTVDKKQLNMLTVGGLCKPSHVTVL